MHPSMLYEIGFHLGAFALITTRGPLLPVRGDTLKAYLLAYGVFRFGIEFIREPDSQFGGTIFEHVGLHMGQWLSLPMILGGLYLMLTAKGRRVRIEGTVGTESVA